jgi:hypothetical protein
MDSIEWSDDDDLMQLHLAIPPSKWVDWVDFPQFPLPLSQSHKETILHKSGWLMGNCINGMMIKLKTEFPNIKGFQVLLILTLICYYIKERFQNQITLFTTNFQ